MYSDDFEDGQSNDHIRAVPEIPVFYLGLPELEKYLCKLGTFSCAEKC